MVSIPAGPCIVEEGHHFAAICWETDTGRQRLEIPVERLRELIQWRKLTLGPIVHH